MRLLLSAVSVQPRTSLRKSYIILTGLTAGAARGEAAAAAQRGHRSSGHRAAEVQVPGPPLGGLFLFSFFFAGRSATPE